MERRSKLRMQCDYPVAINGKNSSGKKYQDSGQLCNLSASGLYMITHQAIPLGEELSVNISLPVNSPEYCQQLAAVGIVLRTETIEQGVYGIAMSILHHRFL